MKDNIKMEALCKGSWILGTACGECARCKSSALEAAKTFQRLHVRFRNALVAIRDIPSAIQDDQTSANMRHVARQVLNKSD